jgi:hypothetical protein
LTVSLWKEEEEESFSLSLSLLTMTKLQTDRRADEWLAAVKESLREEM